ncbi:MAG: DUF1328 domain-containing protein [Opitutae bacterium]|nr:DUF1328 domain-containing protein [Opitutae bacterium]
MINYAATFLFVTLLAAAAGFAADAGAAAAVAKVFAVVLFALCVGSVYSDRPLPALPPAPVPSNDF